LQRSPFDRDQCALSELCGLKFFNAANRRNILKTRREERT
jgi:hypothetical protein